MMTTNFKKLGTGPFGPKKVRVHYNDYAHALQRLDECMKKQNPAGWIKKRTRATGHAGKLKAWALVLAEQQLWTLYDEVDAKLKAHCNIAMCLREDFGHGALAKSTDMSLGVPQAPPPEPIKKAAKKTCESCVTFDCATCTAYAN